MQAKALFLQRIEALEEGIITNGNGIRTQIGAHPRLQEKNVLLSRFESAKKKRSARKKGPPPPDVLVDTSTATMLLPEPASQALGTAKPKTSQNSNIEKWLNKNYTKQTKGYDYSALPEAEQQKIRQQFKITFPMSGMRGSQAMDFKQSALNGMIESSKDFVTLLRGSSVASASTENVRALLNTNPGVISSTAGMIFEAGGKSAFNSNITSTGENFDARTNDAIKDTFGTITQFADFKISESNDLKQDMATKIMRHRAIEGFGRGFIPNFASFGNRRPGGTEPSVFSVASSVFKSDPQLKEDLGGQTKAVSLTKGILKGRGQHLGNSAQRSLGGYLRTTYGKSGGIISGGFIPSYIPNFARGRVVGPWANKEKRKGWDDYKKLQHDDILKAIKDTSIRSNETNITIFKNLQEIFKKSQKN